MEFPTDYLGNTQIMFFEPADKAQNDEAVKLLLAVKEEYEG